jgi:hypothetical protein
MLEQNTTTRTRGLMELAEDAVKQQRAVHMKAYNAYLSSPNWAALKAVQDEAKKLRKVEDQWRQVRRSQLARVSDKMKKERRQ